MYNQPRYKTYAEDNFFRDGASGRPLVPHTVARGHADLDNEYFEGKTDDGRLVTTAPRPSRARNSNADASASTSTARCATAGPATAGA
jgi:hypothetical protein